jgi:hypothetical protein
MAILAATRLSSVRNQIFEASAAFWTDAEIYGYLSDAEYLLASEVNCTQVIDTSITTIIGTQEYAMPATIMRIQRLLWDTVKMKAIDLTQLDSIQYPTYGGSTVTGNPVYYYLYASLIGFYPIPASAAAVKIYGMKRPTAVSAAQQSFTIPDELIPYLDDYVLYRCYLKDQDGKADVHLALWNKNIEKAKSAWSDDRFFDQYLQPKDTWADNNTDLGLA